jgi:hypothetical protein
MSLKVGLNRDVESLSGNVQHGKSFWSKNRICLRARQRPQCHRRRRSVCVYAKASRRGASREVVLYMGVEPVATQEPQRSRCFPQLWLQAPLCAWPGTLVCPLLTRQVLMVFLGHFAPSGSMDSWSVVVGALLAGACTWALARYLSNTRFSPLVSWSADDLKVGAGGRCRTPIQPWRHSP